MSVSHYVQANIPKSEKKNLKFKTLLPKHSRIGFPTCSKWSSDMSANTPESQRLLDLDKEQLGSG
jgi:hypothetical protein